MAKQKNHKWLMIVILLITIASFIYIDYSSLAYLSGEYIVSILQGLFQPDWTYVYTPGSGEDLLSLMLDTVAIAFFGTIIGVVLSIPFILLGAYSLWGKFKIVPRITRGFLNVLRAIPTLIYAILFVRIVGPGEFAGALAIGVQMVGMLGKLIGEAMDNIDDTPVEAMESVGASSFQVFQYGRLAQVMPVAASHTINHFEIAVRSATILGLVGAGGIGAPIIFALQARNWGRVSIILLAIIIVVVLIDQLSTFIRKKLK
ncbi:phosphonate ABC transporter, permease protein PhnE [Aerococcaceae bacterium DSM 111022]|nr:phosphonate ABC transporter, permease protein PhnE [Aerococcaceae bacterium DSM 111022]